MAIYEHLRCGRFRSNGIPYKTDLLADYLSDDSTWNDSGASLYKAGSANIPSIFNGSETNGVESVTETGEVPEAFFENSEESFMEPDSIITAPHGDLNRVVLYFTPQDVTSGSSLMILSPNFDGFRDGLLNIINSTSQFTVRIRTGSSDYSYASSAIPLVAGHKYRVYFYKGGSAGTVRLTVTDTTLGTSPISNVNMTGGGSSSLMQIQSFGNKWDSTSGGSYILHSVILYTTDSGGITYFESTFNEDPPIDTTGNYEITTDNVDFDTYSKEVTTTYYTPAIVSQRLVADFETSDTIDFDDLTDVTIVSYEGDAVLSVSGNSIVATGGAGTAYNLLLSDGTYLPLEGSAYDTSGNGNHGTNNGADLTAVANDRTNGLYSPALRKGFGVGDEEMTDGDMEASGTTAYTAYNGVLSKESSNLAGSTQCLRVANNGLSTARAKQACMEVGKVYRIKGWMRSVGAPAQPVIYDGSVQLIAVWTADDDWHYIDEVFTTYSTEIWFALSGNTASSYAEFDSFTIEEAYIPRLNNLAGYANTVTEEHPALEKGCNNAPVKITFSSGLTGDIMDLSDTAIYNSLARSGTGYDSSNPRDRLASDMTNYKLQAWSESAYLERNYMADIESGFVVNASGDLVVDGSGYPTVAETTVTKWESLLLYASVRTAEQAVAIAKYLLKRKYKEV